MQAPCMVQLVAQAKGHCQQPLGHIHTALPQACMQTALDQDLPRMDLVLDPSSNPLLLHLGAPHNL